jgi:hypothetical protein
MADIATGLTIRILHQGQVHKSSGIRIENASAIMSHDNSTGQPKKSGARCVLIIQKGTVTI